MIKRWIKHLHVAADLARASIHDKRKSYFGAVVARRNVIVGGGVNTNIQHPALRYYYPGYSGIHAEAAAIRDATKRWGDIGGCNLFVTRILRTGEIASSSRPCKYCMVLIALFEIRRVFYIEHGTVQAITVKRDDVAESLGPIGQI